MTWIEQDTAWHRTDVLYCDVTGQLLGRRYWQFEVDGRIIRSRDPHCEDLYRRYVLPRQADARTRARDVEPAP